MEPTIGGSQEDRCEDTEEGLSVMLIESGAVKSLMAVSNASMHLHEFAMSHEWMGGGSTSQCCWFPHA
jgi:hypothetical protein